MQVERESPSGEESGARVSNAWVICPLVGDNSLKRLLIPNKSVSSAEQIGKDLSPKDEPAYH